MMIKEIKLFPPQIVLFFILVLLHTSCTQNKEEIVAEFGESRITLKEFRLAYLDVIKKPDVFDSPEQREQFLDELIASRLLAQEAEKRGYYENEQLQLRVTAYKNKALRDEHFQKVIRPKFFISEKEIREAYIFMQEERKTSHLFAETKQEIDSIYVLLQNGRTFEEIAKNLFSDPVLAENGGNLDWVNWDELEYDLAMTAFRMPTNTFSVPVKSQSGYHILKVTDYKKKPLITRHEYESKKQNAKAKLEFMLGEKYARQYIDNLFSGAEIKLNPLIITAVRSKLKKFFQRKPDLTNQMSVMQLTEDEVEMLEVKLFDIRSETFATIDGKNYTVADFIGALNYIPYNIVYNSFKQAMGYAFRDFLIEQEAYELNLDDSKQVEIKHRLFKEYLLQLELRRDLVRSAKAAESEIEQYYQVNKDKFNGAEFVEVENIIRDIVGRQKRATAVQNFVAQLSRDISTEKNIDAIHAYYHSVLN